MPRRLALLAVLGAFTAGAIVSAACGGSDEGGGTSSGDETRVLRAVSGSSSVGAKRPVGRPLVCAPNRPPYAGPLCGPAGAPCNVLADEVVEDKGARDEGPSIAVDAHCRAHVLFWNNGQGRYADRFAPGMWNISPVPFNDAHGTQVIAPNGAVHAVSIGEHWTRTNGQWAQVDSLSGPYLTGPRSLAVDDAGGLHAALYSPWDNTMDYAHRTSGGWSITSTADLAPSSIPIATSPNGAPHLFYWKMLYGAFDLTWWSPPSPPESVQLIGGALSEAGARHAVAVTPADADNPQGRPHVLFARPLAGDPSRVDLVYATRDAGTWSLSTVDAETPFGPGCPMPSGAGESCSFQYDVIYPVAIWASRGGDVRFLYTKHSINTTMTSFCDPSLPPPDACMWTVSGDTSSGKLFIGWPGSPPGSAPLLDHVMAEGGTATLDAAGNVHVALYDLAPYDVGTSLRKVRYLAFGP